MDQSSYVEVTLAHSLLQFNYLLIIPTLEIDGENERRAWGVYLIELPPGYHKISISYPCLFSREGGKNSVGFRLKQGEVKKVKYHAGLMLYLPGEITVGSDSATP